MTTIRFPIAFTLDKLVVVPERKQGSKSIRKRCNPKKKCVAVTFKLVRGKFQVLWSKVMACLVCWCKGAERA